MPDLLDFLDPQTKAEIAAYVASGKNPLVISQGQTLLSPTPAAGGQSLPGALQVPMSRWGDGVADAGASQKYRDEVEMADRFWRQQEIDQMLGSGARVPANLTAQPKPIAQPRLQFMKSGNDIFQLDPITGAAKIAVDTEEKPSPLIPNELAKDVELGPNFELKPVGTTHQIVVRKPAPPRKSAFDLMLEGGNLTAPNMTNSTASSRVLKFNPKTRQLE